VVFGDLARRRIVRRVHVGRTSTDMTLSPSGRTLVVATGRDLVSVDTRSGRTRRIFTAPFPIGWIAHGAYGQTVAIGDADKVGIVDAKHGRLRMIAHGDASANAIIGMLWASRDTLLIETSGQSPGHGDLLPRLTLLNVVDGTRRPVFLRVPQRHLAALSFLNITPDRRTWFITGADVTANSNDQVATTWALDSRTRRVRWIARGPVGESANALNPSPDSRLLAVGYSHGAIDVLDVATGKLVVRHSSSSSISAGWMAFPPGNRSLVTVSLDGVYRTWAARGSERFRVQAPPDPAVDFTSDGRGVVLVGDRGEIVDLRSGRVVRTFPGFPASSVFNSCTAACFAASPGLRWLTYLDPASRSARIVEIEGRTGRRVAAVTVPRLDAESVAPDGRIVAAYVDAGQLRARVVDPRTGRARDLPPGKSSVGCAGTAPSFTPDSRLMAIVDGCIRVFVWDLRRNRLVHTAVLPDRANAASAVGGGGTTASGAHISPDGRYVLVTVEGGGFVRVDLASGRVAERPGTQTVAKAVAISPDGRYYAIGSQAGVVDEYDARTLRLVRHHTLNNPIQALVFSPDGRQLAVADTDHVLRIWDTCDVCEDAKRLAALAERQSVRELTPGERATFNVG
jgi:WD40 repeat protein